MNRILVLPSDMGGCGMYRLVWPAQACKEAGSIITIQHRMPKVKLGALGNLEGINIGDATTVVVQRPGSYMMPQAIGIFNENGIRVVVDMDDSLSKIDQRNPSFHDYDPRLNRKRNWMFVKQSCEMADLVTCTTEALAEEYGSHGRVKIIKNHVPKRYLDIPRPENEIPIVTWAGYTRTHPGDLGVTAGMINSAVLDAGGCFMAFGDEGIFKDLQIRNRPPNFHQNFERNILLYPLTLSKADIGIVPLKRSPFNEGKSWLKALEYASLGIVPIASPTPDNIQFAELGGCIIAEKPVDWMREVKELILDNDKRAEMSKKVREVARDWIIEDHLDKWQSAWAMV